MIRIKPFLRFAFYFGIGMLAACNSSKQKTTPVESETLASDTLLGKTIRLPDSLEAYAAYKDSLLMDSTKLANYSSFRIYAFMNVSCSSCLPDIDKWNEAIPGFMKYKVPVILLCSAKDNFEYIKFLFENGKLKKFPFPIYLDVKNRFYKLNPFINEYVAHQAVLTDGNNAIISTGNPLHAEEIKATYIKKISKH